MPIGSVVVPFCGLYAGSSKGIFLQKELHNGAYGWGSGVSGLALRWVVL